MTIASGPEVALLVSIPITSVGTTIETDVREPLELGPLDALRAPVADDDRGNDAGRAPRTPSTFADGASGRDQLAASPPRASGFVTFAG